jgi:hypothetical protein
MLSRQCRVAAKTEARGWSDSGRRESAIARAVYSSARLWARAPAVELRIANAQASRARFFVAPATARQGADLATEQAICREAHARIQGMPNQHNSMRRGR